MDTEVRAGIVGLGLAASAHVKGYLSHPRASVRAVCDVDGDRAHAFAREHGVAKVYDSFDGMLADPELNVIDIATPTFLHAEMTRKAAAAGKHVHCEKPFCRTLREGERACASVREHGVRLLVGETYLFLTSHKAARDLIDAGEIGMPLQIRQRHGAWLEREKARVYTGPAERNWRIDPEKSGGGSYPWIFDHAVHFFATAEFFMRDLRVAEVHSVVARGEAGDHRAGARHDPYMRAEVDIPIITWRYEDPSCQGVWMRAERLNGKYDYMRGFSTTIIGEKGMIEVLGEGGDNLFWEGAKQHLVLHREGKPTRCFRFDEGGDDVWDSEISYYSQGHVNQVHHLIDCILDGSAPRYSGEQGMHTVQCTLAAIVSAEKQGTVKPREIDPDFSAYGLKKG
jgi:predicted dehydrogenase